MTSHTHVQLIADFLHRKGLRHVVFSPGSRSAPFVIAFQSYEAIDKYVIPDERVAGYFALGIAQQLNEPVAIVCTSGTAVLNIAPAICEAYHQQVKLIALTADRPLVDFMRDENQTINQGSIFQNFTVDGLFIDPILTTTEKQGLQRSLANSFSYIENNEGSTLHWNVHIPEPLYEIAGEEVGSYEMPEPDRVHFKLGNLFSDLDKAEWSSNPRLMILAGLLHPHTIDTNTEKELADKHQAVLIGENTSNLFSGEVPCNLDAMFATLNNSRNPEAYVPDLLITTGKLSISKRVRQFFKKYPPKIHWHVSMNFVEDMFGIKTSNYSDLTLLDILEGMPESFRDKEFTEQWKSLREKVDKQTSKFAMDVPFSDFKVHQTILETLPDCCNLQLGNSTPVRYAQFFALPKNTTVNANRGTSGIDGCVSTAAGAAAVNNRLTVCVVGDVSFLYDSNALWNNHLSANLRIIVINNSGGNVFRLVEGASTVKNFETFFETKHEHTAKHLASMYGLPYYICTAFDELQQVLTHFFEPGDSPKILEVFTNNEVSAAVYKKYFEQWK